MKKLLTFINKVSDFLKNVLGDLIDLVEEKAPLAVKVVNEIKEVIEKNDDIFDWVFNKVGNSKGDLVYETIKVHLPRVAYQVGVVEGFVQAHQTPESATVALLEHLKEKKKEGRVKDWIFLAAQILMSIVNKKIPSDIAVIATQKAFIKLFGK